MRIITNDNDDNIIIMIMIAMIIIVMIFDDNDNCFRNIIIMRINHNDDIDNDDH